MTSTPIKRDDEGGAGRVDTGCEITATQNGVSRVSGSLSHQLIREPQLVESNKMAHTRTEMMPETMAGRRWDGVPILRGHI